MEFFHRKFLLSEDPDMSELAVQSVGGCECLHSREKTCQQVRQKRSSKSVELYRIKKWFYK